MTTPLDPRALGPNAWLVDEMYRQFRDDPQSVSESWREFFADYRPPIEEAQEGNGRRAAPSSEAPATPATPEETRTPGARTDGGAAAPARPREAPTPAHRPSPAPRPAAPRPAEPAAAGEEARPLRGVAARIVENMEASLDVPTATSIRFVPARLLEENRRVVNRWLASGRGGKISFTHLIGFAVVRGIDLVPAMKSRFSRADGKPQMLRSEDMNLGLAVDVRRDDRSRTLLVPVIRGANRLDFAGFWLAYEELIRKVRTNSLSPDDFVGATATLTNPGTIGTVLSVPRLMPGQSVIVGVGRVDYPSEFQAADPATLAAIGVGKVIGLTSTYDHRVIQGAESGEFLRQIELLLLGEDGFYESVFASLGIPYEPMRWTRDHAPSPWGDGAAGVVEKQAKVLRLINMYRVRGHLIANLDPLGAKKVLAHPELDPAFYGLTVWDLDREFDTGSLPITGRASLRTILDLLRDTYCRTVGVEYMYIQEPDQKRFIQERVEGGDTTLPLEDKRRILEQLNAAEAFETFLHSKYVGHKRFSLEGAESLIPMLDALLETAGEAGVEEVVMGMAHRGRLNVLANTVGKSLSKIFREFEGDIDPASIQGSGDVKYHMGATGVHRTASGRSVAVTLASNPSHLEAVDPVVEGMARAKQDLRGEQRNAVLAVLLHGDAAFAGQGVVAETLAMSQLPGFKTGGTVHIVINNNIGFTTASAAGRSSVYATDVAKTVQAPIFHVNGDDPEACVRVIRLALAFQQAYRKDVVVDLMCYRRYGHNEADDPSFSQPLMYSKIEQHRSVRKLYVEQLVNSGDITVEEAAAALDDFRARLEAAFSETRASRPPRPELPHPPGEAPLSPGAPTGVDRGVLERVVDALSRWRSGFEPHPKLVKQLQRRREALEGDAVDWALAEQLAFGSLILEGTPVRLSGQDTRRGTFSQRHAVLIDRRTGDEHIPLANLEGARAAFRIYDSPLTEYAGMGFEYGYSVVAVSSLVAWEAQFGDFVNGAQIIVDQFLTAAEDKWGQSSGLVLLLPHGFEGQGPEHSSARLERFLGLCAEGNLQVTVPSTPAQYFHLLRRQVRLPHPKPLVVLTPKGLLRLPAARSRTGELTEGRFRELLDDPQSPPDPDVRKVILCSGKIWYELATRRAKDGAADIALVRVEQLYPFPQEHITRMLDRYPNAADVRWVQEEPENMGAWSFMHGRLHRLVRGDRRLSHVSRPESASPASGSATVHEMEQARLVEEALRF